jgi:hypothetical protein
MRTRTILTAAALLAAGALLGWLTATGRLTHEAVAQDKAPAPSADRLDRTVLPIPEPEPPKIDVLDARNAKAPPRFEVKAL